MAWCEALQSSIRFSSTTWMHSLYSADFIYASVSYMECFNIVIHKEIIIIHHWCWRASNPQLWKSSNISIMNNTKKTQKVAPPKNLDTNNEKKKFSLFTTREQISKFLKCLINIYNSSSLSCPIQFSINSTITNSGSSNDSALCGAP